MRITGADHATANCTVSKKNSTMSEPTATVQQQQPQTKRQRAFLGPLPDDFLSVDPPTTAQAYPQPVQGQPAGQGQFRDPHLVPMTYAPQAIAAQPQEVSIGRLKVTIAQAKLNKNYGFTRMDPYCRVRIGHSVYETPTDVNGSKNPRWNKVFSCNIPRGVNSLYVEIFNERYLALDDRIAWAYYEFHEDLFKGETVEEWVQLSGKMGEGLEGNINIVLSLQPAPPPASYQLAAYGNQPISMVPTTMPAAQVYYQGGYPPTYPPQGYAPQPQGVPSQQQQQPAQSPQPPRVEVKEEDVQQLVEMFPTLEKDVIHSVLEASNGQVDPAVTNLLQMTS